MIKTSITGKFNKQGFTLIELVLVIALIGIALLLAVPSLRDTLNEDDLKKACRQIIGLERKLRVEAVRDQIDYILCFDLPNSTYWIIAADMTPEKQNEIKNKPQHLPSEVSIVDIVDENNKKNPPMKHKSNSGKITSVRLP